MVEMTVSQVVCATDAQLIAGSGTRVCSGVCIDSRNVEPGMLFVAFPGERVDGNTYAPRAAQAGAACVVITADPTEELLAICAEKNCAVLRASEDNGEAFLLRLAGAWRQAHPNWIVVGVTGSVGKTPTKDMLACALSPRYCVHATVGNFNNLIGAPLTLLAAPEETEVVVLEMGMNHPGEIEALAAMAKPTLAVITNVGTSHIGLLGSRENIARAKAEIVSGMCDATLPEGEQVARELILVGEDDFCDFIAHDFAEPAGVAVTYVGTSDKDAVRASEIEIDEEGHASCVVSYPDGWSRHTRLPVPGKRLVPDLLLALTVAWRLGVDREAACKAVEAMPPTHMRLEVRGGSDGAPRIIDDTYNASPSSMAAALDVLCSLPCSGRRIAVLGEIGELGDNAQELHALVGAYAAAKPLDMLCLIGDKDAASMREGAITMGMSTDSIETFASAEAAAQVLGQVLCPEDLVLAKASRAAGLDAFVKEVLSSYAR